LKLSDYLTPGRVVLLSGQTKDEALDELARVVAADGVETTFEELSEAIGRRERLMSTGIGHGLAVPHVRLGSTKRAVMAIGIQPAGIADYESLDGEPVRLVLLIVAPEGEHETYIRLLAKAMEVLKSPVVRDELFRSESLEEAYRLLTGAER